MVTACCRSGTCRCADQFGFDVHQRTRRSWDYKEAFKWLKLAAVQGEGIAQANLGLIYLKGQGVRQDLTEAANWFWFAADQGVTTAQVKLAMMYEYGRGVLRIMSLPICGTALERHKDIK